MYYTDCLDYEVVNVIIFWSFTALCNAEPSKFELYRVDVHWLIHILHFFTIMFSTNPQKKKSRGVNLGEWGCQGTGHCFVSCLCGNSFPVRWCATSLLPLCEFWGFHSWDVSSLGFLVHEALWCCGRIQTFQRSLLLLLHPEDGGSMNIYAFRAWKGYRLLAPLSNFYIMKSKKLVL